MTYAIQEASVESGGPVELYDFRLGSDAFLFTTEPLTVTYDSLDYDPLEVKRENLSFSSDSRAEVLKITVPASHPLVRRYINSVPGERATLTIRRVHRTDTDSQVISLLKGTVRSVAFTNNGHLAEIAVMPMTGNLTNNIPRFVFSSVCNNVLFDSGCQVNSASFRFTGEVTAVNETTLTINGLTALGSGWAAGGFIQLPTNDYRLILEHTGDDIRLFKGFPVSPLGTEVDIFAGCSHSAAICQSKFNNLINFGGFPFVPTKNPFQTELS